MNMNCNIKNSEILNILDAETRELELIVLNMSVNMAVTDSICYSSKSDEHKKVENQLEKFNYFLVQLTKCVNQLTTKSLTKIS